MRCLATVVLGATFLTTFISGVSGQDRPRVAWLNAAEAGPDFVVQGEYAAEGWGLQVVALGLSEFDGVLYPGGLPGAGWTGNGKVKLSGKTSNGITSLEGQGVTATIQGDACTVTRPEKTETLKKTQRTSPTLGMKAPAGAVVLFDGSNVDAWNPGKLAEDMLMGVGTRTKEPLTNFTLHLEFRTPFMPNSRGQQRGNSGMYLGDQYECQVLDSFGLEGLDNECGGIYQNAKPQVNACFPPLSWQTYDVEFTAATFDASGNRASPGIVSIKHNGVVIHENLELKPTPGGGRKDEKPGSLYLQDHGDPVRFRNIWFVVR